jgi:hypothetical protein
MIPHPTTAFIQKSNEIPDVLLYSYNFLLIDIVAFLIHPIPTG